MTLAYIVWLNEAEYERSDSAESARSTARRLAQERRYDHVRVTDAETNETVYDPRGD